MDNRPRPKYVRLTAPSVRRLHSAPFRLLPKNRAKVPSVRRCPYVKQSIVGVILFHVDQDVNFKLFPVDSKDFIFADAED